MRIFEGGGGEEINGGDQRKKLEICRLALDVTSLQIIVQTSTKTTFERLANERGILAHVDF